MIHIPLEKNSPFYLPLKQQLVFSALIPSHGTPCRLELYKKSIKSLPQPPVLWHTFQKACERDASSKQLGNIIKDDPVLAAAILRTVNAPGLGVRIAITDVGRAVAHLGSSLVRTIVSRHSFSGSFSTKSKVYDTSSLWKHGMVVSALAEIIAKHIPNCSPENASTLGLFHDIGKMSLNLFTQYQQPATLDTDSGHLVFEYQRFACTHIDLGILLAKHWQLPDSVVEGITYHHHPAYSEASEIPEQIRTEVFAVYLANISAIYLGFGVESSGITPPHPSFEALLPNSNLLDILNSDKVRSEIERISQVEI